MFTVNKHDRHSGSCGLVPVCWPATVWTLLFPAVFMLGSFFSHYLEMRIFALWLCRDFLKMFFIFHHLKTFKLYPFISEIVTMNVDILKLVNYCASVWLTLTVSVSVVVAWRVKYVRGTTRFFGSGSFSRCAAVLAFKLDFLPSFGRLSSLECVRPVLQDQNTHNASVLLV